MPRTGRPRAFNRDEAVAAAMLLFWEYGYESTSLAQLRAGMGNISAASFYAAFESKEALFREAWIDIYRLMDMFRKFSGIRAYQRKRPWSWDCGNRRECRRRIPILGVVCWFCPP